MSVNIKSLINALFKLSGGQAMPSAETITVSPTANNNYIAPTDGYFALSGETALSDGAYLQGSGSGLALITSYSQGQGARLYIPAKKGSGVYLVTSGFVSSNISFTKLVGGGINRLLAMAQSWIRGGELWLTSSIISARSLSCQALKHCRAVRALICRSLPQVSGVNLLQPRLMAMLRRSFSTQKQSNSQTSQQKLEQKSRQTYRQELIYSFAKVISLMCASITQIQLMPFLNSLKPSALLSFAQEVCHG